MRARALGAAQVSQGGRYGSARGPVEQLDRVHDRDGGALRDLLQATNIAGGNQVGLRALQTGHLSFAELSGDLRLQHVVSACRSAAQMRLEWNADLEACGLEQTLWKLVETLSVLQRAGAVISDGQASAVTFRQSPIGQHLRHVAGER